MVEDDEGQPPAATGNINLSGLMQGCNTREWCDVTEQLGTQTGLQFSDMIEELLLRVL